MLKFFTGIFGGWQGYAAVLALGLLIGAGGVWRVMAWEQAAHQTAQANKTIKYLVGASAINVEIGNITIPKIEAAQAHTADVSKEIEQHVTPQIDTTYPVPLGFVRVFNDASHGPIPGPAAGSDADASGVPLSDVAQAHNADEGTLDICRADLGAWWSWYDQQSAQWNKASNNQ